MALTVNEQAAVGRLELYNGSLYNESTNPRGMAWIGYQTQAPQAWNDTALATNAVAREVEVATTQAGIATTQAGIATISADNAVAAKDAAEAAAASSSFPFAVTSGTASAYTLDFTPNQVTMAGSVFRAQFHVANENSPTISVDGGSALEIVNSAGQSLNAGDIAINRIYMVLYDVALTKWVINSLSDTEILKADETKQLGVGYSAVVYDAGTQSSGTFTPNEANGNKQRCVNGGAFTLAPPTNYTNIELLITNNASAGAVTTSGFTQVVGALSTADGEQALCSISTTTDGSSTISTLIITNLQ